MVELKTVRDRLLFFVESIKISKAEFERRAGLSNGYLKNFKGNIGSQKLEELLNAFPELSRVWLMTGEGTMLNQTIKERLKSFIDFKEISVRAFEAACGFSYGFVGNMRNSMQPDKVKRISQQYPELNTGWLMTGEGVMLKEDDANITDTSSSLIPFYDVETTGGAFGLVSSSSEDTRLLGYINTGDIFDRRDTAAIRHVGDSMVEYPDGCILAVRQVLDRNLLVYGQNYVIETDEYRITKRLQRGSSQDTIALYSTNSETYADGRLIHEPFEIERSSIRRIFTILGYIVNQSGSPRIFYK